MGIGATTFRKSFKGDTLKEKNDMYEIADDNGYVFCKSYYIPEEVLSMILSYVPPRELVFVCRRVCKYWCNIIDSQVWKIKLARKNVPAYKINSLPWYACFWIFLKSPLNRNLIKNSCGQEELQHWEITSSGGDGWTVEKPPTGCEEFPKDIDCKEVLEHNSCFATSFYSCTKKQVINLRKEGATPELMDMLQPHITVVDWYCGRFDCSSVYDFKVSLLDKDLKPLDEYEVRHHAGAGEGWSWQKASHVFQGYGPGVKFIEFYHGGMDSQFWRGHYGSKMTGGLVTLSLP